MKFNIGDYIETNADKYIVVDVGYDKIGLMSLYGYIVHNMEKLSINEWLDENGEFVKYHGYMSDWDIRPYE